MFRHEVSNLTRFRLRITPQAIGEYERTILPALPLGFQEHYWMLMRRPEKKSNGRTVLENVPKV